jgi:hypothetical protein
MQVNAGIRSQTHVNTSIFQYTQSNASICRQMQVNVGKLEDGLLWYALSKAYVRR